MTKTPHDHRPHGDGRLREGDEVVPSNLVTRYSLISSQGFDNPSDEMVKDIKGEWVPYSEYAALLQSVTDPENQPSQFDTTLTVATNQLSQICSCTWEGDHRLQGIDCPVHREESASAPAGHREKASKLGGVQRYILRVGHSDDAGLGGEGWVVRMSDHFSNCDSSQKWVKTEDHEREIEQYRGALLMIAEGKCPALVPPMTPEQIAQTALGGTFVHETTVPLSPNMPKRERPQKARDKSAHQYTRELVTYCGLTQSAIFGFAHSHELEYLLERLANAQDDALRLHHAYVDLKLSSSGENGRP